MKKYVALLRGIGPGNSNMRNEKLCKCLEQLGLHNVRSVLTSGNIIFETDETDIEALEKQIEHIWPQQLGFTSTTIIRSEHQLQELLDLNPFHELQHGPSSYLLVTFLQKLTQLPFQPPYQPVGKTYKIIASNPISLFSVTDNTVVKTTDLMTWLEKEFGKEMTSRSWLTVQRILKKMKEVK